MTALLDRRLVVVTGKGGVGKTTVAAAIAWHGARVGKRVLVCELDAKGDLLSALTGAGGARAQTALTFEPRELHSRLFGMVMDPEASLKEYLKINLRIPLITRINALSNAFDFLANAAPGIREIVTIGKLAYEVRERHYDLVVVDASASGHLVGLLRAPQAINELVGSGLIRSQTAWILDILQDETQTGAVLVTTNEELPVNETLELRRRLRDEASIDVAAVVVNRLLPQVLSAEEGQTVHRFAGSAARRHRASEVFQSATAIDAVLNGALLLKELTEARAPHLERLLGYWTGPVALVPVVAGQPRGLPIVRTMATHISDELSFPEEDGS